MNKNIILLPLIVIVSIVLASCSHERCGIFNHESESLQITYNTTVKQNPKIQMDNQKTTMLNGIYFSPFDHSDRADMRMCSDRIISGNYCHSDISEHGFAVCIITVLNINIGECQAESGKYVPTEVRIDSIIEKNPAFALKEGDSVTVAEYSTWFKNDDGFIVRYREPIIPITEEGSQYIVTISDCEIDETNKLTYFWKGLEYRIQALTIPISQTSKLTDDEIYEIMKLPEDVVQCSRALIDHFIKNESGEPKEDHVVLMPEEMRKAIEENGIQDTVWVANVNGRYLGVDIGQADAYMEWTVYGYYFGFPALSTIRIFDSDTNSLITLATGTDKESLISENEVRILHDNLPDSLHIIKDRP